MELVCTTSGHITVVAIDGDVDAATSVALRATLDDLMTQGRERLVIDMADVGFLDSSGLATLVHGFKRVRIGNGDLHLCCLQPDVEALFALTRLDRVFTIHAARSEAVMAVAAAEH
jgi:anti-sigma B factor antagonist